MTWARLDDVFPRHPKIAPLSDRAFRVHVTALCYCAQYKTGGTFGIAVAKTFGASPKHIAELVDAGIWHKGDAVFEIHDFGVYNPSREELDELSASRSKAGKSGAGKRWGSNSRRGGKTDSKPMATSKQTALPLPLPSPVPAGDTPDPAPEDPPVVPPQTRGAVRAARARNGSKRLRDVIALRGDQTLEERYMGKYG